MKSASVYERNGGIYCHSQYQSVSGVWFASEPAYAFEDASDTNAIAEAILACLNASHIGAPHPRDFKTIFKVEHLAKLKSYNTFAKPARYVKIQSKDGKTATLIPTKNGGKAEGFMPIPEKEISVALTLSDLSASIFEAIDNCEI